jgi:antitoxin YefM
MSLAELRSGLGQAAREVARTGEELIVTDHGRELVVIISMEDYERLHEHADVFDAIRLRRLQDAGPPMSLAEAMAELGVSAAEFTDVTA